jgi:integrase
MANIRKHRTKWQVQIRRTGIRQRTKSFHGFEDAKAWARQMEVQADRADLPSDPRALSGVVLGELVQRYRDTISVHKRSFEKERYVLNAFLSYPISSRRLSELRTEDFVEYRAQRLREIKPASVKRQLAIIQHLFEVARDEWGLPVRENPLAKLRFNGADQRRERRLRPGELDKLIEAARSRRNPLIAPIILFAVETGMRRSEILAVRQKNIDLAGRSLLIPETKNGQARLIPLSDAAIALLQSLGGAGNSVFPISANAFRLAWERLKKRTLIEDLRFHDLRHEAISRFFEKGLTVPEVALISGHKDMRMLFRYTHATRQRILEKISQSR